MAQDIIDGINPTRMELLSLKNRTKLAIKGHGLLKEKRDALIKEFFDILDRVKGIRENAEKSLKEANDALLEAQIAMGDLAVRKAALSVKESIDVEISSRSVMGVEIPILTIEGQDHHHYLHYGLRTTNSAIDKVYTKFTEVKNLTVELAEIENSVYRLADSIKKTQKRANALKNIMIPRFEETVKFISDALDEKDREEFSRLKVIKKKKQKDAALKKAKELSAESA